MKKTSVALCVALLVILLEVASVRGQSTEKNCTDVSAIAVPSADLRRWLSEPPRAFQPALKNDLPACVNASPQKPYGILEDIMVQCTDRFQYADVSKAYNDPVLESTGKQISKQSSSQTNADCGCTSQCKDVLASISFECWASIFSAFCDYEIRSAVVGASLQAVYNQLTTRNCFDTQGIPVPLTCDELVAREDPRNDIRVNDVASGDTGVKAMLLLSICVSLLSLALTV